LQASASSGVAAVYARADQELLRLGCRRQPSEAFVALAPSAARGALAVRLGRWEAPVQAAEGGQEAAAPISPEFLEALSAGEPLQATGASLGAPPPRGEVLEGLVRGCTQAYTATPGPTPPFNWYFNRQGTRATLAFALPESDYSGPVLRCRSGSGEATLAFSAPPGSPRQLTVASGGQLERLAVRHEPDQLNGGEILTADLPLASPLLRAFEATGGLSLAATGPLQEFKTPTGGEAVRAFFEACRAAG
jgi:hypothetical protein